MATVTFGDVSPDMRLVSQFYGIDDLQNLVTFLGGFTPVRYNTLSQTDTTLVLRAFEADDDYATFTFKGDLSSLSVNEVYIAAAGVRLVIKGSFVLDPVAYDISGSISSVAAVDVATGDLIVRYTGISLSFASLQDLFDTNFTDPVFLAGADTIAGGNGADYLLGYGGNDRLVGNGGDDTLAGNLGDDTLVGGPGADELRGGQGNDTYVLDSTVDDVIELAGQGTDVVRSSVSQVLAPQVEQLILLAGAGAINGTGNGIANLLSGNESANVLSGLNGNDTLNGFAAADRLLGGAGNDSLVGHAGNDTLNGGPGNDVLTGGTEQDIFRFDTTPNGTFNKDTITFFLVANDRIVLENAEFDGLAAGALSDAAFHKGPGVVAAHDADDRIIYDTTSGTLYYDEDGTGSTAKVAFAVLTNSPNLLSAADFLVT